MKIKSSFIAFVGFAGVMPLLSAQTLEVTSTGVGIGTSTPASLLSIYGDGSVQRLTHPTTSSYSGVAFYEGTTWQGHVGFLGSTSTAVGGPNALQIWNFSAAPVVFGTNGAEKMRIESSGNVGVGTTQPQTRLELSISGSGTQEVLRLTNRSGSAGDGPAINFNFGSDGTSNSLARIYAYATGGNTGDLRFGTANGSYAFNDRMTILAGGNVGIGTTSPSYKLHVSGSVRATSFISDSSTYADFVFKPGYRLAPLSEVESAIKQHGHLPDIPSEAEAKQNGVDIAKMQASLLQKVEELTLYLVEHDKVLQRLRAENETLRRQVSNLEKP